MTKGSDPIRCPYCLAQADCRMMVSEVRFFSCPGCRLVFRGGMDQPEQAFRMRQYYENDYFRELAWDQLEGCRDGIFREALDRIEACVGRGRLLDVGCGCGFFLREAQARGWVVRGLDPSRDSIDYLNAMLGPVGTTGTLDGYEPGERYDAIAMINVLDHIVDPWTDVARAAALLRPGGLLYLRLPNGRFHMGLLTFMQRSGLGDRAGRVVVFHNYAMVAGFLERMLAEQGMTGIAIRNAGLSEFDGRRRQDGRARALHFLRRAVWRGARSIESLSAGKSHWGPSLEVTARRSTGAG